MKVGIVVDNELNGDIRVLREIGILKEQGFEIFVLCFGFFKTYKEPVSHLQITRIRIPRKLKDILFFFLNTLPVYEWIWASRIKKFIISNRLEVLHVHDLYMSRAAHNGINKSKKDIPLILDLHENYPFTVTTYNWTKGFFRNLISRPGEWLKKEKTYLGCSDRIIVLSNDFRDLLIVRHPELSIESFVVLPNVPDLSQQFQQIKKPAENPFKQDCIVIFYYGVIAERRGVFDSLEVFMDLVKENYHVNFLFIGPVDKKDSSRFLKMIQQDFLSGRVYYIPWIDSNDLPSYLNIVDICVAPFHKNPQHESGVANKIYEYMLGGKPIIASDCVPQQNLIERHNCGLVFSNNYEFKEVIVKLLKDKELRERLGTNGYNAIMKEYNTDIVKENLLLMYKTISR
jgi:glycosyltransferase involved in cell wall biosynthesis